jgi:hypothetical protein
VVKQFIATNANILGHGGIFYIKPRGAVKDDCGAQATLYVPWYPHNEMEIRQSRNDHTSMAAIGFTCIKSSLLLLIVFILR